MYYIIYETKNKVNGKFYIGAHKTKNLNDGYMGSGKILLKAFAKYGIDNFETKILYHFSDAPEMYAKEKEIVNKDFVSRADTYNLKIGGFGGWDHVDWTGKTRSNESKKKMSTSAKIRQIGSNNSFYGKTHSDESKKLIGISSKQRAKSLYEARLAKGNHPNNKGMCPHCNKEGQLRALKRWHFNNCPSLVS